MLEGGVQGHVGREGSALQKGGVGAVELWRERGKRREGGGRNALLGSAEG